MWARVLAVKGQSFGFAPPLIYAAARRATSTTSRRATTAARRRAPGYDFASRPRQHDPQRRDQQSRRRRRRQRAAGRELQFTTSGLTANFTDASTDPRRHDLVALVDLRRRRHLDGDQPEPHLRRERHLHGDADGDRQRRRAEREVGAGDGARAAAAVRRSCSATRASRTARRAPWTLSSGVINNTALREPPHAGSWDAWMDGYGRTHTDTAVADRDDPGRQDLGDAAVLPARRHRRDDDVDRVRHAEGAGDQHVRHGARDARDVVEPQPCERLCRAHEQPDARTSARRSSIKFTGTEDTSLQTSFVLDDVTLTVQ